MLVSPDCCMKVDDITFKKTKKESVLFRQARRYNDYNQTVAAHFVFLNTFLTLRKRAEWKNSFSAALNPPPPRPHPHTFLVSSPFHCSHYAALPRSNHLSCTFQQTTRWALDTKQHWIRSNCSEIMQQSFTVSSRNTEKRIWIAVMRNNVHIHSTIKHLDCHAHK